MNHKAISSATLHHAPFRWALTPNLFSEETSDVLAKTFPVDLLRSYERSSGTDKRYVMAAKTLVSRGRGLPRGLELGEMWETILLELTSPDYRRNMEQLTQTDLTADLLEVTVVRYDAGGYVSPHTDKHQKSVGHVIYFSPTWEATWGGDFRILTSSNSDSIHEVIWPKAGQAVVIVRSADSWHCVMPVKGRHPRWAIHVDFWRQDPGYAAGVVARAFDIPAFGHSLNQGKD